MPTQHFPSVHTPSAPVAELARNSVAGVQVVEQLLEALFDLLRPMQSRKHSLQLSFSLFSEVFIFQPEQLRLQPCPELWPLLCHGAC